MESSGPATRGTPGKHGRPVGLQNPTRPPNISRPRHHHELQNIWSESVAAPTSRNRSDFFCLVCWGLIWIRTSGGIVNEPRETTFLPQPSSGISMSPDAGQVLLALNDRRTDVFSELLWCCFPSMTPPGRQSRLRLSRGNQLNGQHSSA